jgi:sugar (pentulose or hexulose) kinase
MRFFLGIDLGTSYFKAGIFDEDGRLKGLGRRFVKKETGDGTLCELPVPVFWGTLRACIGSAVKEAGIMPEEISAVSYSSQANSFILLDENDHPLTPLILWPDERAKEVFPSGSKMFDEIDFLEKTGLGIDFSAAFAVAKMTWFQKKQPESWERVKSVLSISDYLTFSLTRKKVADLSTASMTGLLDVTQCRWWKESLNLFSLNKRMLPTLRRTGSFVGTLTKPGAERTGLAAGIPFYLGGLDHHCAAVGSGIIQNENICESTGTVLASVGYSNKYSADAGCCSAPGMDAGHYFRMAFDDNGALALEWYRRNFAPETDIPELLEMAKEVEEGSEGLIAKPCANKYQGLNGFENVQPFHGHGHFVRAILESTSASLEKLISILNSHFSGKVISTGGGAQSSLWIQIKANKLKTDFLIPECSETACMGAAMIAAAGFEQTSSRKELAEKWVRYRKIVRPES